MGSISSYNLGVICDHLGAPHAIKIKYAASDPTTALILGGHLMQGARVKENPRFLLQKDTEGDTWSLQAVGVGRTKFLEIYEKSALRYEVRPRGESIIKTDLPMFIGEDGRWHSDNENYHGHQTNVVFEWAFWPIGRDSTSYVLGDHDRISIVGRNTQKPLLDIVSHLERESVPYVSTNSDLRKVASFPQSLIPLLQPS